MRMRFPGGLAKALTLSYDDGVEQDKQLIEILNAHGLEQHSISTLACGRRRVP